MGKLDERGGIFLLFFSVWWPVFLVDSSFLGLLISDQERTIKQKQGITRPVSDACPKFVND